MNRFISVTLLTTTLICCSTFAHAGGWTQSKGKGYFKLSQQIVRAEVAVPGDRIQNRDPKSEWKHDEPLR